MLLIEMLELSTPHPNHFCTVPYIGGNGGESKNGKTMRGYEEKEEIRDKRRVGLETFTFEKPNKPKESNLGSIRNG